MWVGGGVCTVCAFACECACEYGCWCCGCEMCAHTQHTQHTLLVRDGSGSKAGKHTHTHTHTHTHFISRITTCPVNREHAGVGLEPTKLRDNREGRTDSVTGPVPRGPCGNPASRTCKAMLTKRLVDPTRCRQPHTHNDA